MSQKFLLNFHFSFDLFVMMKCTYSYDNLGVSGESVVELCFFYDTQLDSTRGAWEQRQSDSSNGMHVNLLFSFSKRIFHQPTPPAHLIMSCLILDIPQRVVGRRGS